MGIEWDDAGAERGGLRPLARKALPVVPVEQMVSVGVVMLAAGDVGRRELRDFYEGLLGLRLVSADEEGVVFGMLQRRVVLRRDVRGLGRVGFLMRDFGERLVKLGARRVMYELLHVDGGLSRLAIVRDPVGNWVYLLETRPL